VLDQMPETVFTGTGAVDLAAPAAPAGQ